MNNLKKVVSFLLAVAMVFSMSTIAAFADEPTESAAPAEAAADTVTVENTTTNQEAADAVVGSAAASALASLPNDDVQYADDYKFDYALGLFEMLEDGYWQKDQVTRSDFATVVAKMLKANTAGYPRYGQTPYYDVDTTSPAYPAICYLTDIGILSGDGNSQFRPNDPILVNEATKMVMCALGYKAACETSYGGYPNGYTTFALRQGIYNGLSISYTNSMNAMQMAKMVRNAMEAYLMESVTYNNDGSADLIISDSRTLLTETYKVYTATGYVDGTYYSYLSGAEVDLENEVLIDGVCYQVADGVDAEALLGYEVNFYYMEDVSGYRRNLISYMEPRPGKNNEFDVDVKNLQSLTATELTYTDANDRERKFSIDGSTLISYNGKPYQLSDQPLEIKQGHITVVTHESNSKAKAIIIQEQFDALFDRYNKSTFQVIFQNNMTIKIPEVKFDTVNHVRFTLDGETIAPEELQKNDAVTYCVSKDGEYIRGYVSRNTITGTVTTTRNDSYANGNYQVVTIDGNEYIVSPYCTKEINSGFSSDFQITYDGKLIGTNASSSSAGNYAYLIDVASNYDAFNSTFMVKLLDKYGEIKEFTSATKVNSNINREDAQYSAADVIASGTFDEPQVVVFELNAAGELRSLYAATDNTAELGVPDDLDFGMYFNGTATYSNSLFGTCAIDDSTLIFSVPYVDRDRDEDYSVLKKADMSNGSYTTQIYDIRNGIANVIVLQEKEPSKVSDTAKTLVVDEFSIAWDEQKMERVQAISGYSKGEYVTYMIDDEVISRAESYTTNKQKVLDDGIVNGQGVKIEDLKRGDVIQYELGSNDYISRFRVLNNYSLRKDVADPDTKYFEINQDGQESYKLSSGDECYLTFGKVRQVHDFYFVETSKVNDKKYFRAYPSTDVNLYVYDLAKDELRIGEPFDIEQDDDVFIRTKNLNSEIDIVVYQY